jgi:hypothetical protein
MKKKIYALLVVLSIFIIPVVALPQTAHATNVFQACKSVSGASGTDVCSASRSGNPFLKALKVALQLLVLVVGFVAVVMLIMNALKIIWAQGDPAGVKSGRDGVIGALVGLVVAALSQAIVTFVLNKL